MGAHPFAILRSGGDHDRGGSFFHAGDRVWVQKAGRGNFDTFGVLYGGLKIDKEAFAVFRNVPQGETMNCELVLVRSGAEGKPGRVTDRDALVELGRKGTKKE